MMKSTHGDDDRGQPLAPASASRSRPKIMICVTEDWFALSHFKPLIRALLAMAADVVVLTRSSGRLGEIEALGARTIAFDYRRSAVNPAQVWKVAGELRTVIAAEQPDCIHLIALKPIVTAALATAGNAVPAVAVHLTGLGLLAVASSIRDRIVRRIALAAVRRLIHRKRAWLFVENEDDLAVATAGSRVPATRATILGGAGVDPTYFAELAPPTNTPPVAAYVGRLIRSKGIDTLVEAARRIRARNVPLRIDLYGMIDHANPEAYSEAQVRAWESEGLLTWHGHVADVRDVWRRSDIFVMAPRGGEGMPRSMLEAAACARPLVVTDVPGCRQFVRDGIEGRIIPPGDPSALADALAGLATDATLRRTLGAAARARVLSGFTERHVAAAITEAYRSLLAS